MTKNIWIYSIDYRHKNECTDKIDIHLFGNVFMNIYYCTRKIAC